jgi:hypothetical protein
MVQKEKKGRSKRQMTLNQGLQVSEARDLITLRNEQLNAQGLGLNSINPGAPDLQNLENARHQPVLNVIFRDIIERDVLIVKFLSIFSLLMILVVGDCFKFFEYFGVCR